MYNTFINVKYLPNFIKAPGGQYIHVHSNAGVTYTKTTLVTFLDTQILFGTTQRGYPTYYN